MKSDPSELNNVIDYPKYKSTLKQMKKKLNEQIKLFGALEAAEVLKNNL